MFLLNISFRVPIYILFIVLESPMILLRFQTFLEKKWAFSLHASLPFNPLSKVVKSGQDYYAVFLKNNAKMAQKYFTFSKEDIRQSCSVKRELFEQGH